MYVRRVVDEKTLKKSRLVLKARSNNAMAWVCKSTDQQDRSCPDVHNT
jgi:hypothetical protein